VADRRDHVLVTRNGKPAAALVPIDEYEALADAAAGRVRATVTSAIELTPHDRDRVADELSKRLGKEIRLRVEVDPTILGGLKFQYGDHLVDASVATRLQQLRRTLAAS